MTIDSRLLDDNQDFVSCMGCFRSWIIGGQEYFCSCSAGGIGLDLDLIL